jgi:hypothetical protein
MGIGAIGGIIGGIGSLASAGVGIAGALGGGGGGPNLGDYASRLNQAAKKYILPFAGMNNPFWNIDVPGMATQGIQFGLGAAPQINQFNMEQLQGLLNQALPGYQGMVSGLQTGAMDLLQGPTTQSLLAGNVPADVQNQIRRSAAYQSLIGGTAGAGTGTAGAITARDLGLTSLDLINRGVGMETAGAGQATSLLQLSRNFLMPQPVNPLSLLPLSDLIQGTEWQKEATYKANAAAYTAQANTAAARIGAPPQNPLAGVGGAIQGLLGNLTTTNPQTGKSQLDSLLGLFGLGGGGGGGFDLFGGNASGFNQSGFNTSMGGGTVGSFMGTSGGGAPSLGATSDFSSLFPAGLFSV